jgi:hypothetical protein
MKPYFEDKVKGAFESANFQPNEGESHQLEQQKAFNNDKARLLNLVSVFFSNSQDIKILGLAYGPNHQ